MPSVGVSLFRKEIQQEEGKEEEEKQKKADEVTREKEAKWYLKKGAEN